ncbi:hypothetical protein LUZ63_012569 [Rhynchospora breviuscula]|uniref:Pollen Ole e 1 allergen and extensin family protein n=1 Tax=Rhynchospora breviuscula TaxID=2022672 RepID=A0A9Q0CKX9_9POAL|nr:hypothetical protein LUZ63_012569 [Rhynchospora breviuscula]
MIMNELLILVVLLGVTVTAVHSQGYSSISGYVWCCENCTDPAHPFANAIVQVQCGTVVAMEATTDSKGFFSLVLVDGLLNFISSVLNTVVDLRTCTLNVYTPLSQCDATLTSSGFLLSNITSTSQPRVFAPVRFIFYRYYV